MDLQVVILAAGGGKRMKSALPKVLHKLAGKHLLQHVIETANKLNSQQTTIICGHGKDEVKTALSHLSVQWIEQAQQLGTGHAVLQAVPALKPQGIVLILFGDVPLITVNTLQSVIALTPTDGIGLLVAQMADPYGLGRIITNTEGDVTAIIEEKDATPEQKQINEIFSGIMAVSAHKLKSWVSRLTNDNAQNEYYLTDIITLARDEGCEVKKFRTQSPEEVSGINDRKQLATCERYYQRRLADELMLSGVTLSDPNRLDIKGELNIESDVTIDVNVILEGRIVIGKNTQIAANNVLRNSTLGKNVVIKENCIIEDAIIEDGAIIGPFARIRPDSVIQEDAHVGNFVEIKKSNVGPGSKVNHLSYIGDCEIGSGVNVGAGTITCNYDGAFKHKTIIEDNCFIGSDSQLVAPVTIRKGSTIGAGSTITQDTKPDQLTLSRVKQMTVPNWKRPQKKENSECVES